MSLPENIAAMRDEIAGSFIVGDVLRSRATLDELCLLAAEAEALRKGRYGSDQAWRILFDERDMLAAENDLLRGHAHDMRRHLRTFVPQPPAQEQPAAPERAEKPAPPWKAKLATAREHLPRVHALSWRHYVLDAIEALAEAVENKP